MREPFRHCRGKRGSDPRPYELSYNRRVREFLRFVAEKQPAPRENALQLDLVDLGVEEDLTADESVFEFDVSLGSLHGRLSCFRAEFCWAFACHSTPDILASAANRRRELYNTAPLPWLFL